MSTPSEPLKLSVIICTHNPREDYLLRVLNALRLQSLPSDQWELLLIDNGSSTPLAQSHDLSWHPHGHHVREDQLGLTAARLCGIRAATSDLLVFVDDDNVLESHYLEVASSLALEWPKIGVFGGSQIPEYEKKPATEIARHAYMLAVRTIPATLWTNIKGIDDATPRGAGLCIRRHLAVAYMQLVENDALRKALGRSGKNGLLSGEDTDMVWTACDLGYGMLVTPALTLTHLISHHRLEKSYLLKIAEGHAASGILMADIHRLPASKSRLIDSVREFLRVLQAPSLFDKRMALSGLWGRRRGREILQEAAK